MAIGMWQIVLILVIVLILFGAGKLPKVMGDLGKGMRSFKDGIKEEGGAEERKPEQIDRPKQADGEEKS